MSIEEVTNPGYEQQQQATVTKSKKGWFACGGIGCLILFLFCGGIIGVVGYFGIGFAQTLEEVKTMVKDNQAVKDALGEPVKFKDTIPAFKTDETVVEYELPIEGADGTGIAKIRLDMKSVTEPVIEAVDVKIDDTDESIDVLNSSDFDVEIEDVGIEDDFETDAPEDSE